MGKSKIVFNGNTVIDLTADTVVASALLKGYTAHDKAGDLITGEYESKGLPTGIKAIAKGTHTLGSAVTGSATFTVNHNLGEVPDMFLFYADGNIASTYSMLYAFRSTDFNWRSTSYLNLCGYHGNSTSTLTCTNVTTSYGIKTLTSTQATITSYSTSNSYGWRAGNYKWIAIKFG